MIFTKRDPTVERIVAGRTDLVFDHVAGRKPEKSAKDMSGDSPLSWASWLMGRPLG